MVDGCWAEEFELGSRKRSVSKIIFYWKRKGDPAGKRTSVSANLEAAP